uniref:Uncharacterized protein n=1 Tax=Octopus bimaculoides TaxID=37653 RepID=A0A0L8G2A2_OCTBM
MYQYIYFGPPYLIYSCYSSSGDIFGEDTSFQFCKIWVTDFESSSFDLFLMMGITDI